MAEEAPVVTMKLQEEGGPGPTALHEHDTPALRDAPTRSWTFTEELYEDLWPSLAELESAGAYDHEGARARIRDWQYANPRPAAPASTRSLSVDSETIIYDRRKLNLGPLPSPQLVAPNDDGPDSPSNGSSGKMSPLLSVVRRASLRRPKAPRTKSTDDAPCPPPAPLVSPLIETSSVKPRETPTRSQSAAPDATYPVQLAGRPPSLAESAASRTGHRKLVRKSHAGAPTIRTDTDYLSVKRPSYSPHLIQSPSALSPGPISPTTSKRSWRRSFPLFSSAPSTPTGEIEAGRMNRSPSPVDSFPREARREKPLPAVDSRRRKRSSNSSLSDSYLGDGEGSKPARTRREFGSASPSTGSEGAWEGLKAGGRSKAGSRSTGDWNEELLERSVSYERLVVLSRSPRPSVTRSHSDTQVDLDLEKERKAALGGIGSSSSLNLDKIEEQPEDPSLSRQPSIGNLSHPLTATFGARTRTPSSNTTATAGPASMANTSRAPSPTRIISAKSSHSAFPRAEHPSYFTPSHRITSMPLDIPPEPASSASEESSPILDMRRLSLLPATPDLIRSRGDTVSSVSSSSRQGRPSRFGGPSESDLSLSTSETTWDASEGEEETAASSSAECDEVFHECLKEQEQGPAQVQVEGERVVVGW